MCVADALWRLALCFGWVFGAAVVCVVAALVTGVVCVLAAVVGGLLELPQPAHSSASDVPTSSTRFMDRRSPSGIGLVRERTRPRGGLSAPEAGHVAMYSAPLGPNGSAMSVDAPAPPQAAPPQPDATGSSRSRWILVVCCVAQFMVILDLSIVNVALPSIQDGLGFSSADLQWVVDAYAIAFAGFLMIGGRAADQLGQRRVFVTALALFGAVSLVAGFSVSPLMLVIARGVQGFSCAFMAASSLAIITSSFPPGPQLHRAIALWAAMNGLGGAAGTLFGGIITQTLGWKWIFLINPPIAVATAVIAYFVVADRRRAKEGPVFDVAGAATLTIGQMVLVYGVVQSGIVGWHAASALVPIIAGLVLLTAFGVIESRFAKAPLIPFKELTRPLLSANAIVILFSAALFPMWYVGSLYLQQVLNLSPLHTGLIFLPMALTIMLVASRAGRLVSRSGSARSSAGG